MEGASTHPRGYSRGLEDWVRHLTELNYKYKLHLIGMGVNRGLGTCFLAERARKVRARKLAHLPRDSGPMVLW